MCRPVSSSTPAGGADDKRKSRLLGQRRQFHGVVVELIHRQSHEVRKHDFGNGSVACQSKPYRGADHASLADRGRDNSSRKFSGQAGGDFESTSIRIMEILTKHNHLRVISKQPPESTIQCCADGNFRACRDLRSSNGGRCFGKNMRRDDMDFGLRCRTRVLSNARNEFLIAALDLFTNLPSQRVAKPRQWISRCVCRTSRSRL